MKFFHLIWSNLKRKKLRTVLTLLSIMVACLLFSLLCAVKMALTGGVSMAGADRLVVRHKTSLIQLLPASYEARMEKIPGVASAVHLTWFGGIYQDPKNFMFQAPVVPDEFLEIYPEYVLPEEQHKKWNETRIGAIAGRSLINRFGWKIGDRIPIQPTIWGDKTWEFELVGIYDAATKKTDTSGFYFRYDYFDETRGEKGKGLVGWYTVKISDPNRAAEVAQAIDEEFANSSAETKTDTEAAFAKGFADQVGDIGTIVAAIASAVFFTILLVAGNTMAQAVRERTEELGVLKAMGFSDGRVMTLVLFESIFISLLGGLAGLGLGFLVTSAGDPTGGMMPLFYVPAKDFLIGVGLVLALGIATGAVPAWQALRLHPAEALRRM